MQRWFWLVNPAAIAERTGVAEWPELPEFERAEILGMWIRGSVPRWLGRHFDYRVSAMGVQTRDGHELFLVESGRPDEF